MQSFIMKQPKLFLEVKILNKNTQHQLLRQRSSGFFIKIINN